MPRVIHFEIPVDDPERAARFYERIFAWKIVKWDGPADYWTVSTGEAGQPGIDGGLQKRVGQGVTTNTIDVPSVDAFVEKVVKAGGQVVLPKMPVPGVGYLVYCTDTEGNVFGMMESDESAK
jgi:uncharacterized protein